jgi:two-component system cell cycle response regulator DivK
MTKKILVVEDQADLRRILTLALKSAGLGVVEATNGVEAVARAKADGPDLILMDIQLPIIDGYEAMRQIRATETEGTSKVPIIAISSFAMKGDAEKARAAGCDAYVTKPYSPMQLMKLVREMLPST